MKLKLTALEYSPQVEPEVTFRLIQSTLPDGNLLLQVLAENTPSTWRTVLTLRQHLNGVSVVLNRIEDNRFNRDLDCKVTIVG